MLKNVFIFFYPKNISKIYNIIMIDIIAKLLPVIILSILFLHKDETIDFSHTILGKLIAVTIILF